VLILLGFSPKQMFLAIAEKNIFVAFLCLKMLRWISCVFALNAVVALNSGLRFFLFQGVKRKGVTPYILQEVYYQNQSMNKQTPNQIAWCIANR
jgi:hypothetical protein